jgi:hypothetical protein
VSSSRNEVAAADNSAKKYICGSSCRAVVWRQYGRFQMIVFVCGFVIGALACPALITLHNWRARRDQA